MATTSKTTTAVHETPHGLLSDDLQHQISLIHEVQRDVAPSIPAFAHRVRGFSSRYLVCLAAVRRPGSSAVTADQMPVPQEESEASETALH